MWRCPAAPLAALLHIWRRMGERIEILEPGRWLQLIADMTKMGCFQFRLLGRTGCSSSGAVRSVACVEPEAVRSPSISTFAVSAAAGHTSVRSANSMCFTHRSLCCGFSYERLEFLGDSVASCILSGYIFRRFVKEDESFMTRLRSHMISGKVYAEISRQIGLPGWLRLHHADEHLRLKSSVQEDIFESFIKRVWTSGWHAGSRRSSRATA